MTTTHDEIAARITEAFLAPVREVGFMLAKEIDRVEARLDHLIERVDKLERETSPWSKARAGKDT